MSEPNEASVEDAAPLVEARGVTKVFGDAVVLDRVDLAVRRGETVVVVGGSGSGKSTLAHILVGLEPPTSGAVLVEGRDLGALRGRARAAQRDRIAIVFQRHALLDSLDVFDNVAFALREGRGRVGSEEAERRVKRLLAQLGLEHDAAKLPGELSGGMAKRVAIARALAIEPEIVVYDEPTAGLDPPHARTVDALIERARVERGVASIVITHDMATVFDLADEVALLERGRIVWQGPPEMMVHHPLPAALVVASGVDVGLLRARRDRPSGAAVRAAWRRAHPSGSAPRKRHRFWQLAAARPRGGEPTP